MKKIVAGFIAVFMAVHSSYSQSCTAPPSGLVAWWQAEGNANDSIGNNNGTLMNETGFTDGKVGQAFSMNGVNNFVLVNAGPSLTTGLQNGFTYEAWINPANVTSVVELYEYERVLATFSGLDVGMLFAIHNTLPDGTSGSCLYANVLDTNAVGHIIASPANLLTAGVWQHVALTYDTASGAAAIYINGVSVTQTNLGSFAPQSGFTNLLLGARTTFGSVANPPNAYDGSMDEVGFYSRALSSNEIAAIYSAGSAGKCFTPVAPVVTAQPANQTVPVGGAATFSATASGTAPLSYQWQFGGTNIVNATNTTLLLTNVQLAQAGSYSLMVSNIVGSTNSTAAVLAVNVPPSCTAPPSGLVSWWQAEGNAYDSIGNNNGTLVNGTGFATGEVGNAFNFNGVNNYVLVNPVTTSLDVGQGSGLTIECWINTTSVTKQQLIASYFRVLGTANAADTGMNFGIIPSTQLYANVDDANHVGHEIYGPANVLAAGVWQHVAVTYDKASGLGAFYINGIAVTQTNLGSFTPLTSFTNLVLGAGMYLGSASSPTTPFSGGMDEVGIYSRALASNEIAAIYNAGSLGKCFTPVAPVVITQPQSQTNGVGGTAAFNVAVTGTAPISYQWQFGGTNILNATNASLVLNNVQLTQAGNYSMTASNIVGSTNSAVAVLTILTYPPSITTQPVNQTVQIGGAASFAVTATGTAPLLYQWNLNGTNIVGATNATFTFTNVQLSQSGNYAVTVTNAYGSAVSSNAALSVIATLDHFAWGTISSPQFTNQPFAATITAQNQFNVTVTNFTGAVSLQASGNGALNNSGLILNGGFETGTLTNWTLVNNSIYGQFVINNGTVVPPGATGTLASYAGSYSALGEASGPGAFYMYQDISIPSGISAATLNWAHCVRNYYSSFNSGQAFQVRICDTNNNVLATAFTTSPGNALLGGWVQTNYNMTAFAGTKVRVMFWVDSTSYYIDAYVDNVSLQLSSNITMTPTNTGNFVNGVWNGNITLLQPGTNVVLTANDGSGHAGSSNPFNLVTPTNPPVISTQPVNQTLLAGGTATFSVTASGTAPLSYQWSVNTTNIAAATNATLTLTNVQLSQSGNYSVLVSNSAGSTNSAIAVLTVNVPVSSPAPSGLVSWWQAESNANDSISGNNGVLMNGTSFTNGKVGNAFNLNGANNYVLVNPASTNLDLGAGSGLTIECWIKTTSVTKQQMIASYFRVLGTANSADTGINFAIQPSSQLYANLTSATTGHELYSPANVLVAGVWQHIAVTYDKASGIGALYINGAAVTQTSLGSFTPLTSFTNLVLGANMYNGSASSPTIPFSGGMDEVSFYNRALASNEIAAIYNAGSAGKIFTPVAPAITSQPANQTLLAGGTATFSVTASGTAPLGYQWSVNTTNIAAATNATLTLNNVQVSQAGNYTVMVSNSAGSTNSAIAVLTLALPPVITQQPANQTVLSGNSASFTVAATGTGPLSYQWRKNGTNLVDGGNVSGSGTTNLNLAGVTVNDAGNYDVVASNPYATTNSVVAVLTVPQTTFTVVSTNAMSGSTVVVPVLMNAVGAENAYQASVSYDPTKLVLQSVQPGPALAGAGLQELDGPPNSGLVGFVVLLNTGATQPAGANEEVADLVFTTLPVTNNVTVNLTFGDSQVVDNNGDPLPASYQNGTVSITPAEYEADVYPRPTGDHQVGLSDWVEIGKMVAGLDTPTNSDEMLRADCAPRNAPDGVLTVADWVQAGRYEEKADPLTLVTAPPAPSLASNLKSLANPAPTRTLQVGSVAIQRGQTVSVPVQLVCSTNENALGMTIGYDASRLKLLSVNLGSATAAGRLNVNTNQSPGEIGVALAMLPGQALAAGTNQVAVLQFMSMSNASGPVALSLDGSVVKLQLADKTANVLPASYVNGAVVLPPQPVVTPAMTPGANLQLSWQIDSGTFQVQSADSPLGPWTIVPSPTIVTNGANATVSVTATNNQKYFRLVGQ